MQRFLLIRVTALGDVVLVEPVVRALRRAFPGAAVDLVTEAALAPLMARGAGLDAVVGYDRRGADRGLGGIGRVLARLPAPQYDAVIDLQGKLRTRLLARRVRARVHLTLRKRTAFEALLAAFGSDPPIVHAHAIDLYLGALSPLGISSCFAADGPARARLGLGSIARPSSGLRVGLGIGAAHATKRWPPARFAALASALSARFPTARFVAIGGPADRASIAELRAEAGAAVIDPVDATALDVAGLAELIATLDLLISVDSGAAHVGAALGVPVVVVFGPTSPVRWGPRGAEHRVVSLGLECAPCSNTGGALCPLPSRAHACLLELPVEQVEAAALEVIAALPDRRG